MQKIDLSAISQEEIFDWLADDYDLLLEDWRHYCSEQGELLHGLFNRYRRKPVKTVLDCTCGIGTQCIGLAPFGYILTGTDISGRSIARARREAETMGADVTFDKADIRRLDEVIDRRFDAVISCDNSLPLLLTEVDLAAALEQMNGRLNPGGLCVISLRNYDAVTSEKSRIHPRNIHERGKERIIVFDLRELDDDGFVVFHIFYVRETEAGVDVRRRKMVCRAVSRRDFVRMLESAGFQDIERIPEITCGPSKFDFYLCYKPDRESDRRRDATGSPETR